MTKKKGFNKLHSLLVEVSKQMDEGNRADSGNENDIFLLLLENRSGEFDAHTDITCKHIEDDTIVLKVTSDVGASKKPSSGYQKHRCITPIMKGQL